MVRPVSPIFSEFEILAKQTYCEGLFYAHVAFPTSRKPQVFTPPGKCSGLEKAGLRLRGLCSVVMVTNWTGDLAKSRVLSLEMRATVHLVEPIG